MKKIKPLLILSCAAFFNFAHAASSFDVGDTWLKSNGHSTINYNKCKKVDDIRIKTEKEIWLSKVVAKFETGKEKTLNIQTHLKKNGKSNWLSLGKKTQCLDSITIYGDTKRTAARISVQGRK